MIRKITWKQQEILKTQVAKFLTRANFQPGKFQLVPKGPLSDYIIVVYVDHEDEFLKGVEL